ncbi:MAG: hypothetical protein JO352_36650 [Chloroflexi bacterium]|nr:hypothetical protein [Chloroflexota bacterium]
MVWTTTLSGQTPFKLPAATAAPAGDVPATALGEGTSDGATEGTGDTAGLAAADGEAAAAGEAATATEGDAAGEAAAAGGVVGLAAAGGLVGAGGGAVVVQAVSAITPANAIDSSGRPELIRRRAGYIMVCGTPFCSV